MVSQNLPSEGVSVDSVDSDQAAGAAKLVRFLAERGHTRILRLWGRPQEERQIPLWLELRNEGFETAAEECGIEVPPPVYFSRSVPAGLSAAERFEHEVRLSAGFLLEHLRGDSPPDAIMTISDSEHYEAAAACEMFGLKPQQDITIVGYDNYWRETDGAIHRPDLPAPAATIDKLNAKVGRALVELLQQRIDGELPAEPQHRVIEPELIILDKR
jgi:DNA-binding LacI/PurR family transcriptional regulator